MNDASFEQAPRDLPLSPLTLKPRDLFFAALNGLFIGVFAPFVFKNISVALPVSHPIFAFILTALCIFGIATGFFLARLSPKLGFFFQLAKFGLIGTANCIVDLGIFSFFIWKTGIAEGNMIIVFKIISVSIAIVNSYIWNKFWAFDEKRTDEQTIRTQFVQFLAVSISAMVLNTTITYILIHFFSGITGMTPERWATASSAIASVLVLFWNFVGYKFFVFAK
ncbi:MAG: GtrA family protein [Candidatus Moraniibacteriota bacterium]|nr:MAG: GtrA family protein [Candidatus Moranbacteria bacterium]